MPISVLCPGCSAKLNAPDAAAGLKLKCPKCAEPIAVPAPVTPAFEVVEDDAGAAPKRAGHKPPVKVRVKADVEIDDATEVEERPARGARAAQGDTRRRKRKQKKRAAAHNATVARIVATCVVLVALIAVGGGVALYFAMTRQQETVSRPPASDEPRATPGAARSPGPVVAPPAQWRSDPRLDDRLGAYQDVGGFQVRPPKGYTVANRPGEGVASAGAETFAWTGPRRASGTSPMFMVVVMTPPPVAANGTVQEFLSGLHEATMRRQSNCDVSAAETGEVNGLAFLRSRWSGTDNELKTRFRGLVYAGKLDGRFVQLVSLDADTGGEADLALAEAAALTFRKK